MSAETSAGTPFYDLGDFVSIPRVGALRLSPDGSWLAAAVQTLSADRKKYLTSIWRIDPQGGPARRLTRSAEGEGNSRFLPDGSLLFTSKRPDPGAGKARAGASPGEVSSLWLLPAAGGEARVIAALPGGVAAVEAAPGSGAIVVSAPVLPAAGGNSAAADARLRQEREDAGITAILHESAPVRFWDHDLGPDQLRLFAVDPDHVQKTEIGWAGGDKEPAVAEGADGPPADGGQRAGSEGAGEPSADGGQRGGSEGAGEPSADGGQRGGSEGAGEPSADGGQRGGSEGAATFPGLRDLTPEPGRALDGVAFGLTPDGTSVVSGWCQWHPAGVSHRELVMIDVATGKRRVLLSRPEFDFGSPCVSPDGRFIACLRETRITAERPMDVTLVVLGTGDPDIGDPDIGGPDIGDPDIGEEDTGGPGAPGESGRDLLPGLDRWPQEPAWSHDSGSLYFAADDGGRRPVFRVEVASGAITRVTVDDGAYSELNVAPDGRYLYALRATVASPPTPVRIDLMTGAEPAALDCPGVPVTVPGRLAEVEAAAEDGQPIRSWLVLPETASASRPAPLLLWVHGGPMNSWNSWSWRWNPWLMAARGYAVLLPDPALSTGYGQEFIARAHREWGERPFADIMAATDAALARPDIDPDRVAMMGGSYGGYMANWMASHTDRFRAIVSHAGLWMLDQMFGTTDEPMFWRPQFGDPLTDPEMYELNSPHRHIGEIRTPMLVIHGNKDYRVPVSEALRLWWDLSSHGAEAKFLYFPDENHWILTPGNARIWYETVFAFLAQHVLGQPWQRPALL